MFKRVKEDFKCEYCDERIVGDGYTNHCPKCLWSMHVDNEPGDRQADCGGMMRPIDMEEKGGKSLVLHRCIKCGHKKKNKLQKEDNFELGISLHNQ